MELHHIIIPQQLRINPVESFISLKDHGDGGYSSEWPDDGGFRSDPTDGMERSNPGKPPPPVLDQVKDLIKNGDRDELHDLLDEWHDIKKDLEKTLFEKY